MKKLLGLTALAAVLVLAACGNDTEETVCTLELEGFTEIITVQSEDDEIVSAEMEMRLDVSDLDDDEIEGIREQITSGDEDVDCDVDGDTLVCTESLDEEGRQAFGIPVDLEEFIAEEEAAGATCN